MTTDTVCSSSYEAREADSVTVEGVSVCLTEIGYVRLQLRDVFLPSSSLPACDDLGPRQFVSGDGANVRVTCPTEFCTVQRMTDWNEIRAPSFL